MVERNDDVEDCLKKLEGVDAVFNLAGAPIVARWNEAYKKVLHSSRIDSTKKLVEAINQSHVSHFISTSAVGIYPNDVPCDEETTHFADDFLGKLALEWEAEAKKCQKPTAILRFGVVLGHRDFEWLRSPLWWAVFSFVSFVFVLFALVTEQWFLLGSVGIIVFGYLYLHLPPLS